MIDLISSYISLPINSLLDLLPSYPIVRPLAIVCLSYAIAVLAAGRIEKFKYLRVSFLTAVVYLALSAVGVS
jgi:hypothetical protein